MACLFNSVGRYIQPCLSSALAHLGVDALHADAGKSSEKSVISRRHSVSLIPMCLLALYRVMPAALHSISWAAR
jgi:hypothetical protein